MEFPKTVCPNCEENLKVMAATQKPECVPCAIATPLNEAIASLREKTRKLKEKGRTLYNQNLMLISVNIDLQQRLDKEQERHRGETSALKKQIEKLENKLKKPNSGEAGEEMEVGAEVPKRKSDINLIVGDGALIQIMGERLPVMRPLIQKGVVVRQPKASNKDLKHFEETVIKILEEEG